MDFERRIRVSFKQTELRSSERDAGWHFCPHQGDKLIGPGDDGFADCGCAARTPPPAPAPAGAALSCFDRALLDAEGERANDAARALRLLARTPDDLLFKAALALAAAGVAAETDEVPDAKLDPYSATAREVVEELLARVPPLQLQATRQILTEALIHIRSLVGLGLGVCRAIQLPPENGVEQVAVAPRANHDWLPDDLRDRAGAVFRENPELFRRLIAAGEAHRDQEVAAAFAAQAAAKAQAAKLNPQED